MLGFTPDEWERMPWWQQRLFCDGLADMAAEREAEGSNVDEQDFDTPQPL